MKRLYTLLIVLFTCAGVKAQPSENSWISYSQNYYKIKVWEEGIFRLHVNALLGASIPVTAIDHRTIQLWHNGVEQYLYVYDQNGNDTINGNDYLEFYGQKNDGSLDAKMYAD